jgi:electron transfer flavoprotein beta subunit
MKVLVSIKRVIDFNVTVRVKPDNSNVDLIYVKMALNPFCEIDVEEAVRLKEAGTATEVIAISIGDKSCQEQLRTALALGCDRAIKIQTDQDLDALNIAKLLQKIVEEEQPQLVILGKQSIENDNNQTGQMLAALIGLAQGKFAYQVKIEGDKVNVTREVDSDLQTIALNLPAIVTTDLRLNEPRYASLPNIMRKFDDSLPLKLLKAREAALNHFRPLLKEISLTEQQWRIIRALNEFGALESKQLAECCCILSPSLTGIIARLEQKNFIQRKKSSEDKRRILLSLTGHAQKVFDDISPRCEEYYRKMTEQFGQEKMQEFKELLELMATIKP